MGWLLRRFFRLWVRAAVQPPEPPPSLAEPGMPVCYVLDRDSRSDLAVLCNVTEKLRITYPEKRSASLPVPSRRSYFDVGRRRRFWDATDSRRPPAHLLALIQSLHADPACDVLLVPTAVYWGRAPQKEGSWLRLLFAEDWALTSRVRKFFRRAGQRPQRDGANSASRSEPALADGRGAGSGPGAPPDARTARQYCAGSAPRASGPIFRTVAPSWRACCARARCARWSRRRRAKDTTTTGTGLLQARKYAFEIAANYSHAFVQIAWKLAGPRVEPRSTTASKFNHVETLKQVSEGNEVVYVPCHRSHMDYLLLSYVIYHAGLRAAAHRRGHQSQPAGGRALPAQGRRVLHPPQLRAAMRCTPWCS